MVDRLRHWLVHSSEPFVEVVIRLCGWSSIIFVFGIFFFIFREGVPFLTNDLRLEVQEGEGGRRTLTLAEVPYENPQEKLIQRIKSAVEEGKIHGVTDVRSQIVHKQFQVAMELEEDADPEVVSDELLRAVPLRQDHSHIKEFFTSPNWRPDSKMRPQFGTFALLLGTLSVTLLAMVLSVPFGLGAAIYVSEFCGGKLKETLKIVIELLAAIPSVVWGFIGYMVMNPLIIWATGREIGINMLNGGIILALMSVPIIVSVGEDALKAVPASYREAAVALGASRWQVVYRVLLPAAKNGLLAAVLLGIGRSIGETMAVLMATGHAVQIPHSILDPVRTLTATIAAELGETVEGGGHYRALFVIGMVLMIMAFVVNLTADVIVKGVRGKQNA